MNFHAQPALDLMPPPFADGLDDWSCGDGTPDSGSYAGAAFARLAVNDPDFGICLELRKIEPVQRLRYMGELPLPRGAFVEISARLKAVRGPLAEARIAAWPGGAQGRSVPGLATETTAAAFSLHFSVLRLRAVIGPEPLPGVDLVWDSRALYAHVGLDLVGPSLGVVRIEGVAVREVTHDFAAGRLLPGFAEPPAGTPFRN